MKRILGVAAALLMLTASLMAQPEMGSVAGIVQLPDGTPVPRAMVNLAGINGGHGGHHPMFRMMTTPEGTFNFDRVPAGPYNIDAMVMMGGHAAERIEVLPDQTTNVTLTLQRPDSGGHGGGHGRDDSLVIVELQGTAIVIQPDTLHPRMVRYALDVDGDAEPDYGLNFGPPWYNPPSGAVRPANGDVVTVVGGLFTYGEPPMVIVYEINGLLWREPRGHGHGGHGGGDHFRHGCNPDSIFSVEFAGTAIVISGEGFHGEWTRYFANTDEDTLPEFVLDFGGPDYVPPSGALRPENGDDIAIVGGELYCPRRDSMGLPPIVIVYEINGLLWREPGDTVGLGPMPTDAIGDPVVIGAPTSYVTASNYPNPFNPTTTIMYSVPTAGLVTLKVFDIVGREVADLVNTQQLAGSYALNFDGSALASGIYFYRVSVNGMSFTNRMVLMK